MSREAWLTALLAAAVLYVSFVFIPGQRPELGPVHLCAALLLVWLWTLRLEPRLSLRRALVGLAILSAAAVALVNASPEAVYARAVALSRHRCGPAPRTALIATIESDRQLAESLQRLKHRDIGWGRDAVRIAVRLGMALSAEEDAAGDPTLWSFGSTHETFMDAERGAQAIAGRLRARVLEAASFR